MHSIYPKLKAIRESKKLSQQQMADKLHIVVSGYGKIERGLIQITIERLEQIATIFEMTVADILSYKEIEEEKEGHLNNFILKNDSEKLKAYQAEINSLVESKVTMRSTRYVETIPYEELEDWDLYHVEEQGIKTKEEYLSAGQPAERFTPEGDQKAFEEIIEDMSIYMLFENGFITDVWLLNLWDIFKKKGKPKFKSVPFKGGTFTSKT